MRSLFAFVFLISSQAVADIHPVIRYATLLSGEKAHLNTVDSAGNQYVAGLVHTLDSFPATGRLFQGEAFFMVFVTKLDPAGKVVYNTLVGPAYDVSAMTVDAQGSVYVYCIRNTPDMPITAGALNVDGGFLFKLNASGSAFAYSCRPGFSPIGIAGGFLSVNAMAVDGSGNVYLTGSGSIQPRAISIFWSSSRRSSR